MVTWKRRWSWSMTWYVCGGKKGKSCAREREIVSENVLFSFRTIYRMWGKCNTRREENFMKNWMFCVHFPFTVFVVFLLNWIFQPLLYRCRDVSGWRKYFDCICFNISIDISYLQWGRILSHCCYCWLVVFVSYLVLLIRNVCKDDTLVVHLILSCQLR